MNLKDAVIERESHPVGGRDTRFYRYDGKLGLSVSAACSLIVPYHLQSWYKKNSEKKIDKRMNETANLGTDGHALIESQAKGVDVKPKEYLKEWFEEWNKTQKQYEITAEMNEEGVFSKVFGYGGTPDRVGMFQGRRTILDFKTGSYSHLNLYKTEAYRQAYIEMTGDKDIDAVVLHLPRPDLMERGQKVRHYRIEHHIPCFLAFLSAYYDIRMYYGKDLQKAGMEDVYAPLPFMLYEREYGTGSMKNLTEEA